MGLAQTGKQQNGAEIEMRIFGKICSELMSSKPDVSAHQDDLKMGVLTWSKSSQVEHQTQQNQPRVGRGAVVVGPVDLIFHQGGVGTSGRETNSNISSSGSV